MTPKTKCDFLIGKFIQHSRAEKNISPLQSAKKCALICVDEILNTLGSDRIIYGSEYRYQEDNFWNDVKTEINNL